MELLLIFGAAGAVAALIAALSHRTSTDGLPPAPPPNLPPPPSPPPPAQWPAQPEPSWPPPHAGEPPPPPDVALDHQVPVEATSQARPPSMADWAKILAPLCIAYGIPLPFALAWVRTESAGNPCAVGDPTAQGEEGMPREVGIIQLFNPDDLRRLGVSATQLRAYCVPGLHPMRYKNRIVMGFSQAMARAMTVDEVVEQAKLATGLIKLAMDKADAGLAAIHAGPGWNKRSADYWSLVKLQHALPGIARTGLPAVTQKLGRAPASWQEFRATLGQVTLDAGTQAKRAVWDAALANAAKTGAAGAT